MRPRKKAESKLPEITVRKAVKMIRQTAGKDFKVKFLKRSTGELRKMFCRLDSSHVKGGERAYDFDEQKVICVWDIDKQGYRMIPQEGILEVNFGTHWIKVLQPQLH